MVIEELVSINAPLDKVWKSFTDLTCWQNWNSVMKDVASDSPSMEKEGLSVSACVLLSFR